MPSKMKSYNLKLNVLNMCGTLVIDFHSKELSNKPLNKSSHARALICLELLVSMKGSSSRAAGKLLSPSD